MRRSATIGCLLILAVCGAQADAENWSGWRGPSGDGTSGEKGLPTSWNGEAGENVAWKVKLPGEGHGSPIAWEDRIFLAACLPDSQQRVLVCLDRQGGEILWQQTVLTSKLETKHTLNSHASCTPATDGRLVFVAFLQTDGRTVPAPNVGTPRPITPGQIIVVAYDFEGNQKWKAEVGEFVSAHGFCSNPVLHEDLVIINGDHDGDSYIVALDRDSGEVRWRQDRPHGIRSYATPIIREFGGRAQMVLSGSQSVVSYDPQTGRQHWTIDGPTEQFVASMVCDGNLLFLTAGFPEHHILAIRPDGRGNVTDTHIAWRTKRGAAYVPSPIVVGDYLLVISDGGIASCFDAAGGERHWMERLGTRFSGSPIAAGGLAYFTSDKGETTILRPGPRFEKIAECKLGEPCYSSPAVQRGSLIVRGREHLFCIREE